MLAWVSKHSYRYESNPELELSINLHRSTANVNLQLDSTQGLTRSLTISKDAKAIVPSDIAPVQRPGHSWR